MVKHLSSLDNDDEVGDVVDVMMMMMLLAMQLMKVPQESSNLGQWWDSDFCSPLPTVTQYGKECSNA